MHLLHPLVLLLSSCLDHLLAALSKGQYFTLRPRARRRSSQLSKPMQTLNQHQSIQLQLPQTGRKGSRPPSFEIVKVINTNMKKNSSSSKKKKALFVEERSGEQTATPRVKKSYSVTNANYLQLQLDTSAKKRQTMQKTIQIKDKRIHDLEKELRQQQDYVIQFTQKYRQTRRKWEQQRNKGQRLQQELQEAVDLCKAMKNKCRELMERNQNLAKAEQIAREKAEFEEKKLREIKEQRKKEKSELRRLIIPLLEARASQGSLSPQELTKVSKVL